jgi:segregation and condensation protein B
MRRIVKPKDRKHAEPEGPHAEPTMDPERAETAAPEPEVSEALAEEALDPPIDAAQTGSKAGKKPARKRTAAKESERAPDGQAPPQEEQEEAAPDTTVELARDGEDRARDEEPDADEERTRSATPELSDREAFDEWAARAGEGNRAETREDSQAIPDEDHLRGLLEALVFASDKPIKLADLAEYADAPQKQVRLVLEELQEHYLKRGLQLMESGGGYIFRTHPAYAPYIRALTGQKPVKLTRSQLETLAILAYRQPITRPEIDDIRGVDSGPVLKMLLERNLIRILGKRDEAGRPILYGTTHEFLEFFGLGSLKELPSLKEFTELSDESRKAAEEELGERFEVSVPGMEAETMPPSQEATAALPEALPQEHEG